MDYVFALTDAVNYQPGGGMVTTARGQVWRADDPFVKERPDIFSSEPPVVHNTVGATQLDARPLTETTPARKKTRRA